MDSMARRLKARRVECGLEPVDLSVICGCSLPAVIKWEDGRTENLKHEHEYLLADALNVNARWLTLGEGPKIKSNAREAYLFVKGQLEKSSGRARIAWEKLASTFARGVAIVLLAAGLFPAPADAAPFLSDKFGALYIMLNALRRLFRAMNQSLVYRFSS